MPGLQNDVFVGFGIAWGLAILAMIGRVMARRMTKASWSYEDYFCLSAFLFGSAYNILCLYWCTNWSLGQIIPDTVDTAKRDEILQNSRKLAFFCSLSYSYSIGLSKIAILSLYWRLFKMSSIRNPIILLYTLVWIWIVLRTFLVIFRCSPVAAYWDETIPGHKCNIKDSSFFFGTVLPHFLMDCIILVLPIVEIIRLHLQPARKIAVTALFLLGIVVCVASVKSIILSLKADPQTKQMPYDYALNYTWGGVEVNIAVVSSCFPLLRPIFRTVFGSRALSTYAYTTHGISYGRQTQPRANGFEMSAAGRRRKSEADILNAEWGLGDEEKGILGDPAGIKPPDRVFASVTTPHPGNEWRRSAQEGGIHVRNEIMVKVQNVARSKSFSSDGTSQNSV